MDKKDFINLQFGNKIKNSASGNEYYILGTLYPEGFVAARIIKIPIDKI